VRVGVGPRAVNGPGAASWAQLGTASPPVRGLSLADDASPLVDELELEPRGPRRPSGKDSGPGIHPDDPPFPIFGLPRIISTEQDLEFVVNAAPSTSNGLTFCTGSLGAREDNDLSGIVSRLGRHFHFLHLRNVQREAGGSFHEANHLGGSTDMYAVMKNIILEQKRRADTGRDDVAIPMRPDHGHKLLDDFRYNTFPGYSAIGRLKGLAELRGLEMGIKRSL